MLILTRKPGESITIRPEAGAHLVQPVVQFFQDQPIRVCVQAIDGGVAKLGISAHRSLKIVRDELLPRPRSVHRGDHNIARSGNARHCLATRPSADSDLAEVLLRFSNDFTAFNQFYACFCDTLADMLVEDRLLDASAVEGLNRCTRWMKQRMDEFRRRLEVMQKKSCDEIH